ncbi:TSUP family transporter [Yoonia sp. R2331]|uniref:TSUP family transporter n=1 Tax=Yoonia sp. R2331 TaxID=3237238 RepID=UPI0034E56754
MTFVLAAMVAFGAGVVKGTVGFAMPTIMISGLSSLMAPELALAALLLPTLVTNGWQALRQVPRAAWASIVKFRVFLIAGGVTMLFSAQLVPLLSMRALLLIIGVPIIIFALLQLAGWAPRLARQHTGVEAGVGVFTGFIGGLSGVWGPPTVAYLTALDTPKVDQVRLQGAAFGLGAVLLVGGHVQSGILRLETAALSAMMLAPALLGMAVGLAIQDRIDQRAFRRATLLVLLIAGANLIRRALV